MAGPLVLILLGVLLVLLANYVAECSHPATWIGCLPGIPAILCIAGGILWLLTLGILWIFS